MKPPPVPRVTHCLEVDHRARDATLLEADKAARTGSVPDARRHFAAFSSGLTVHIEAEERVLFPRSTTSTRPRGGPTSAMRAEHAELRSLLRQIGDELATATGGRVTSMRRLKELLLTHNTRDERALYPIADVAARGRSGTLAQRLRATLEVRVDRA